VYKVVFTKQAHKILLQLPCNLALLIRQKLEQVAYDPFAEHPNARKLQNRPGYRLRVGDWRVIYEIQENTLIILVLKIAPRGEIYK